MRTRLTCLLLTLCCCLASAETLAQGERDQAMSALHATRKQFLDAVAGLSPAQWNYKPAPDRWSVAEVAEHLTIMEDSVYQQIQQALKQPAQPERKSETAGKDADVMKMIPDRSHPVKTSDALTPKGTWKTEDALVKVFRERRDRTIEFVEKTQEDLRAHFPAPSPIGLLDCYQWTLLLAAHTERHLQQIQEVKDSPGFPKR